MKRRGFTFIEMVMVIVIISVIAGTGIPLLANLSGTFHLSVIRKDLSESAETALRRMSREIRRLQDISSVITASGSVYRFTDIDGNDIRYRKNGTTLQRRINGVTDPLADNVSSLSFAYYDDTGSAITSPASGHSGTDIRLIAVDITFNRGNDTVYYRAKARPLRIKHLSDIFP